MDIHKQVEWLRPDRIMKLYDGEKSMLGMNRLLIIGVGKNGTDCLMRAKHIAENRFNPRSDKLRFLAFGEEEYLDGAEYCGSVLREDEKITVNPEKAVYQYLDDPDLLSPQAREWFDMGLKNYSPNAPKYGLQKRQGGRIALFHCIEQLLARLDELSALFSKSENPLEITVVGNLGDAFFGGTVVDFGYILTDFFKNAAFPVKVNALMFAGDTAQLFEKDARDLANYYANTILTKGELDVFQSRKAKFSQKYTEKFAVSSEKPPYNACYIASAEKSYALTLEAAAEKLLSAGEFIYKTDDDADRVVSYNMLDQNGAHTFRYLAYGISGMEIPLGKIVSYLSVKLFADLCGYLKQNSAVQMQLSLLVSRVTPDAMLLASRAGTVPKIEYDEKYNPLFTIKSLKKGAEASKNYITEKIEEYAELVKKGAEENLPLAVGEVTKACDEALGDFEKGPFCAQEIIRACLERLKTLISRTKAEKEDADELIERRERLLQSDYRKLKGTPAIMAGNAARLYISSLSEYAECLKTQKTADTTLEFYQNAFDKLKDYSENTLSEKTKIFSVNAAEFLSGIDDNEETVIKEAFEVNTPEVLRKLDKLVADVPEETKTQAFKKMKMIDADENESVFASEIVNLAAKCFGGFLLMGYNDFCEYFGVQGSVKDALQSCFDSVCVKTPALDDEPLTRVLCPKSISQGDVQPLKSTRQGINYIWNVSPLFNAAIAVQIKGGVKIDEFKDYNQWENMRYAYVNDSLKKHGIHIFRNI